MAKERKGQNDKQRSTNSGVFTEKPLFFHWLLSKGCWMEATILDNRAEWVRTKCLFNLDAFWYTGMLQSGIFIKETKSSKSTVNFEHILK